MVVAVRKLETDLFKKVTQKMEEAGVMPLPPIRSVSSSTCIQYTQRFSPKAELKVHVFLNVGHQQGCKVVTSGTSVKINVFFS